ncbi:putative nuclease HARBI1 [Saccostrea echinata]|uniref:putative nuclease HARBI1 n=1 Tax=Saccostrea echinata TaxID=191078 RepID=UPI002A8284AD|nr:putative nuclease HARBI1 [Saccostrea echinata]
MAAFMRVADEQVRRNLRRQRVFRDRQNPLDAYDDMDIIHRYRLDRRTIISIIDIVQERLERPTKRSRSLPDSLQVFAALRFLASGSQYRMIGDTLGISKPSVCRSIDEVINVLCRTLNIIKFPTGDAETTRTKVGFHAIAGFPNVLGAIDGTHIPVTDEHLYVCRKGYHSISVQAIADYDMK